MQTVQDVFLQFLIVTESSQKSIKLWLSEACGGTQGVVEAGIGVCIKIYEVGDMEEQIKVVFSGSTLRRMAHGKKFFHAPFQFLTIIV